MSTRRIPLRPQSRDVTFSLLFVAHGFTNRATFHSLCTRALKRVVRVPALDPFRFLTKHIRAWTSWPVMPEVISKRDGGLFMDDPPALFGHLTSLSYPVRFPFEFWVDPATRFRRGVVVLTDRFSEPIVTPHYPVDLIVPDTDQRHFTYGLGPFVVMTAWPFVQGSQPVYINDRHRERAMAGQLAQAIGFLLGLGPEADIAPGPTNYDGPEPLFPNVTKLPATPSGSTVDLANWKWRAYRKKGIGSQGGVEAHPGAAATASQVTHLVEVARAKTLVLEHPSGTSPVRYVSRPLSRLAKLSTHMIEGGLGFSTGIYRPRVECTMRYSGWNETLSNGAVVRHLVEFCPVCHMHLRRVAYGLGDYYFSTPRVVRGVGLPRESNVARAFKKFVEEELPDLTEYPPGDPTPGGPSCTEATTHRVSKFFEAIAPHYLEHQKGIPLEDPNPWGNWQRNGFGIPSRRLHGDWVADLWLSRLNRQRDAYEWLEPYVALGAPGALAWAQFGEIVNGYDVNRSGELGIPVFRSLSVGDLATLTPGSMLQIWIKEGDVDSYDWAVRYTASDSGRLRQSSFETHPRVARPGDTMPGGGHSLIFLGPADDAPEDPAERTAEHYLVADQMETVSEAESLGNWATDGYNFWIAMEWYPMEGLPQ